jgi:hypothetical protein
LRPSLHSCEARCLAFRLRVTDNQEREILSQRKDEKAEGRGAGWLGAMGHELFHSSPSSLSLFLGFFFVVFAVFVVEKSLLVESQ